MRTIPSGTVIIAALMALILALILFITLRNYNPQSLGIMPGPVQEVLSTPTLSGHDIAWNILTITGNQSEIGHWKIPGNFNYGPVQDTGDNTWYVTFDVPIKMKGIIQRLGYRPPIETSSISSYLSDQSTTLSFEHYVGIVPLPSQSFDRLYFDPNTHMATFSFRLDPYGQVIDESWDAVAVNS